MKAATVEVWGSVFGQDVLVKEITGTLEEITEQIQTLNPNKGAQNDTRNTLNASVWSDEVQWMGGHQIGMRVIHVYVASKIMQLSHG